MIDDKIKFKRILSKVGDSTGSTYPPELLTWINAQQGDQIIMIGDKGKHGKYIAIWKGDSNDSKTNQ